MGRPSMGDYLLIADVHTVYYADNMLTFAYIGIESAMRVFLPLLICNQSYGLNVSTIEMYIIHIAVK